MNQERYTTAELLTAAEIPETHYKQLVRRGQLVLSAPRAGTGRMQWHNQDDVLQAAVHAHLSRLGVGPTRAARVWAMACVPNLHREALIFMAPRADDSDLDVRVVLPGGDDGMERDDAPAAFALLNLPLLQRRVAARLDALPRATA